MRLVGSLLALVLAGGAFADTLKLRSGRVVNGTYLGGTSRQIRMEVADRIETFDVGEVTSLEFGAAPATAPNRPGAPAAATQRERLPPHARRRTRGAGVLRGRRRAARRNELSSCA